MSPLIYDTEKWLEENKKYFVPPICNKLMYKHGQLKAFFVGGPNTRKDFHLEEGEEFFYQLKGNMNLIVYEEGKFKNVVIKEGQVFLLPPRLPHSPQRSANTIGLVIEREREPNEMDCLRYYVENSDEILYEKWFHCDSLEELGPLIKEYFASEQYKTGKPIPGTLLEDKPVKQDFSRKVEAPFDLKSWLHLNHDEIEVKGRKDLFGESYISRISVLGGGNHSSEDDLPETFFWQMEGEAEILVRNVNYQLKANETMLIDKTQDYVLNNKPGARTMRVIMNPQ